jgi:predicted ATP-dependent serine protease
MSESRTAKQLASQKFNGITIAAPYGKLLGPIELSAIGFIWGPNYSGKSTLALGMANAMAKYGRVEFVPAEEQFGITLTQKINRLKAYSDGLHFRHYKGLEELRSDVDYVDPTVVYIDSVSVLNANDDKVIDFAQWCRDRGTGLWMVSHANKDGSYKGSSKFGHEADIRIQVNEDGVATTEKNRYWGELRSIDVPMEASDIDYGSGSKAKNKEKARKSSKSADKRTKQSDFDSRMAKVEQLLQSA